jgi:hypothetical protein
VVETLPASPFVSCDGHAAGNVQALFVLESGVALCGHHARLVGIEHTRLETWLTMEDKLKGSEN